MRARLVSAVLAVACVTLPGCDRISTESAFFLHDVGVVLLSKAVKLSAGQYGKLPTRDELDALKPSSSTLFTAVGYGVQRINPAFIEAEIIRMFAEPHLIQIDGGI